MLLLKIFTCLSFLTLAFACNQPQLVQVRIIERKHLPGNKLQLKYMYLDEGKMAIDSLETENTVLEGDSITIQRDESDPLKTRIVLERKA